VKVDGEFGERWAEEAHGNRFRLPSGREIVDGLAAFYDLEVTERVKNMPKAKQNEFHNQYKAVFEKILELVNF